MVSSIQECCHSVTFFIMTLMLETVQTDYSPIWKKYCIRVITRCSRNSVTHLRSCPATAHLQNTYTNSPPSKGVNFFTVIELDH